MSYILEALKKSQQERELGVVPSLQAVSFDDRAASESPHRWVYVALLLAGVAVAIALFAVLRADPFGSGSAMVASTTEVDSLPGVPSTRVSARRSRRTPRSARRSGERTSRPWPALLVSPRPNPAHKSRGQNRLPRLRRDLRNGQGSALQLFPSYPFRTLRSVPPPRRGHFRRLRVLACNRRCWLCRRRLNRGSNCRVVPTNCVVRCSVRGVRRRFGNLPLRRSRRILRQPTTTRQERRCRNMRQCQRI